MKKPTALFLKRAAAKIGWSPFHATMAILSAATAQAGGCLHQVVSAWPSAARSLRQGRSLARMIPPRGTLRQNAKSVPIAKYTKMKLTSAAARPALCIRRKEKERPALQKAKAVSCPLTGGDSRLLCLSASNRFPNASPTPRHVGKEDACSTPARFSVGVLKSKQNDTRATPRQPHLLDFYELGRAKKRRILWGWRYRRRFDSDADWSWHRGIPPGTPRWGKDFKAASRA